MHAEGIVLYRGKVYIPDNPQLRHDLVHAHHSATVVRHPRHWKMLELVSWNYWWPGLSRYIAKFVAGCNVCNQTKTSPMQKVGKLIPNKIPDQCWQVISIDMIGELPDSKGYNAVLVVVDHLSKRIHTILTVTSLDSAGVAWLFLKHVWHYHGLPEEVISDHSPTFISNFSHELAAPLRVKLTPSTSYCQSTTLHIKLCAFPTHLQCISKALPHTLTHCVSDPACYTTLHCPLHPHLHMCCLCLFVCLFTFVTGACVACFVCLFPLLDWFH